MRRRWSAIVLALCAGLLAAGPARAGEDEAARERLAAAVEAQALLLHRELGLPVPRRRVMDAIRTVPRHRFVPEPLRALAYINRPLPVGFDQNTAEPYLVALMTELAAPESGDRVFETGTGAGYHAAVLARLAGEVFSMEVVAPLARRAAEVLAGLGIENVRVRNGDGYYGWPEAAPFDVMIIKESMPFVPPPLLAQLRPGGRLVAPLGPADGVQMLTLVRKTEEGRVLHTRLLPVRFSPLQGGARL